MTKGRAMLTLAAASEGWTERPQVIREFHFLGWAGGPSTTPVRDDKFEGSGPPWHGSRWSDRVKLGGPHTYPGCRHLAKRDLN
jgi:hypothetical protein